MNLTNVASSKKQVVGDGNWETTGLYIHVGLLGGKELV
jgi:hypothetical protein